MTLATADQCSEATARALTDQLRKATDSLTQGYQVWEGLVTETYQRRAWASLGYADWDAYVSTEVPALRQLRLGRPERRELVASLTEAGMSTRAIGSALGVGQRTVVRDQRPAESFDSPDDEPVDAELVDEPEGVGTTDPLADRIAAELAASDDSYAEQAATQEPARVLGTDGKTYPVTPPKPSAPRRRALPDAFWEAMHDLGKQVEKVARLCDDDRFPQNAEQVAAIHRNDLLRAIDALQGVINRLPSA